MTRQKLAEYKAMILAQDKLSEAVRSEGRRNPASKGVLGEEFDYLYKDVEATTMAYLKAEVTND